MICAAAPDGKTYAVAHADNVVYLYQANGMHVLRRHNDRVHELLAGLLPRATNARFKAPLGEG